MDGWAVSRDGSRSSTSKPVQEYQHENKAMECTWGRERPTNIPLFPYPELTALQNSSKQPSG